MAVGVLSLQGSFNEHISALRRIGVKGMEIRKPEQLHYVTALIIPGRRAPPWPSSLNTITCFLPCGTLSKWGSLCGGPVQALSSWQIKLLKAGGQELVGGLDCTVSRNFFGRQLQSFEIELVVPEIAAKEGGPNTFRGVFIRAPAILEVGPDVEVLADYSVPSKHSRDSKSSSETQEEKTATEEKVIVAVKQGTLLGTTFHPELTAYTRWHSYFLKMAGEVAEQSSTSIVKEEYLSDNRQQRSDLPIFQ